MHRSTFADLRQADKTLNPNLRLARRTRATAGLDSFITGQIEQRLSLPLKLEFLA